MVPNEKIAGKVAEALRHGLTHPGNPETGQPAMTVTLPGFNPVGLPPEVAEQLNVSAKLMAEAIVALIETDHEIVTREDAQRIRTTDPGVNRQTLSVSCRCGTTLAALLYDGTPQVRVDGRSMIRGLAGRDPACPHKVADA